MPSAVTHFYSGVDRPRVCAAAGRPWLLRSEFHSNKTPPTGMNCPKSEGSAEVNGDPIGCSGRFVVYWDLLQQSILRRTPETLPGFDTTAQP